LRIIGRQRPGFADSQNGNRQKINLEKVAFFPRPKSRRQLTSFHQKSTTNSPQKNHVLPLVFAKNPCKNARILTQKNNDENQVVSYSSGRTIEIRWSRDGSWHRSSKAAVPPFPSLMAPSPSSEPAWRHP
jgi:hypothetical protein